MTDAEYNLVINGLFLVITAAVLSFGWWYLRKLEGTPYWYSNMCIGTFLTGCYLYQLILFGMNAAKVLQN